MWHSALRGDARPFVPGHLGFGCVLSREAAVASHCARERPVGCAISKSLASGEPNWLRQLPKALLLQPRWNTAAQATPGYAPNRRGLKPVRAGGGCCGVDAPGDHDTVGQGGLAAGPNPARSTTSRGERDMSRKVRARVRGSVFCHCGFGGRRAGRTLRPLRTRHGPSPCRCGALPTSLFPTILPALCGKGR